MNRMRWTMVAALGLLAGSGCGGEHPAGRSPGVLDEFALASPASRWSAVGHSGSGALAPIELTSPSAVGDGVLPERCTCRGRNLSPALRWGNVPEGTRSLAILIDDPGAARMSYSHWVLFNLSPTLTDLPEGLSPTATPGVVAGAATDALIPVQGTNSGRNVGYEGPCPLEGQEHHYVVSIYALDTTLGLDSKTTRDQFLDTIDGHLLGEGRLVLSYPAPKAHAHE